MYSSKYRRLKIAKMYIIFCKKIINNVIHKKAHFNLIIIRTTYLIFKAYF